MYIFFKDKSLLVHLRICFDCRVYVWFKLVKPYISQYVLSFLNHAKLHLTLLVLGVVIGQKIFF